MQQKNYNPETIVLGGYNFANTARLWASLTALVAGEKLGEDIPDTVKVVQSRLQLYTCIIFK